MRASSGTALPQPPSRPMTAESYKRAIEVAVTDALDHYPNDPVMRSQMFCAMLSGWIGSSDKDLSARIQLMYAELLGAAA